jgi:hypothetical protein
VRGKYGEVRTHQKYRAPSEAMELGNLLAASCVLIRPQLTPEDNYRAHQFYTRCLIREEELLCTGLSHRQVHA